MGKKKRKVRNENFDELGIQMLFAEYARAHVIDTNWQNIDNPVYLELSKRSGKPKNVIRDAIYKMQPSVNLRKCMYVYEEKTGFIYQVPFLCYSWFHSDVSSDVEGDLIDHTSTIEANSVTLKSPEESNSSDIHTYMKTETIKSNSTMFEDDIDDNNCLNTQRYFFSSGNNNKHLMVNEHFWTLNFKCYSGNETEHFAIPEIGRYKEANLLPFSPSR